MMRILGRSGATVACLLLTATVALAVPAGFNVQGRLTDSNGVNRNGGYSIRFTIFDSLTGGAQLWTQTFPAINVVNGSFQTTLADVSGQTSLVTVFAGGNTRFLEIDVLSGPGVTSPEPPLVPRQQLVSVPYAIKSSAADSTTSLVSTSTGAIHIADGSQAAGKVLTSDAGGIGSWQTLSVPTRHYASVTTAIGNSGPTINFVITPSAFNPPLPAGTTSVSVIEVYCVAFNSTAPGGGASVAIFDQGPGTPFHGSNPSKGIYQNVLINDVISVIGVANSAAGGGGSVSWLFVAIP